MAGGPTWRRALEDALAEQGTDGLVDLAIGAVAAETDLLDRDPDLATLARASTAANLAMVVELVRGSLGLGDIGAAPQAVALARELARRNIPIAELARAYRLVQHVMWRFGVRAIRERLVGADEAAAAIEEFTDATLATGEVLMGSAMERYAAERDRWVRSADAVRRATVEDLLAGGAVDVEVASRRLGYELRREHRAFVVWAEDDEGAHESAAVAIGGPGALVVPTGAGVAAGWAAPAALGEVRADGPVRVAIGDPGSGLDGFRRSHAEAREARRVARLAGLEGVVRYADVALVALLTSDLARARTFAQRRLGALGDPGEATTRLADTVLAVLQAQGSPRHAAQRLGVHENTVAKRVRAAEEALGHPLGEQPAELMAALLIRRAALR